MGENAMRALLASILLVALGASANAATVHHHRHAVVAPEHGLYMGPAAGWAYAPPPGPAVRYAPRAYFNDQPDPTVDSPYKNWGG
jgi:hypothetical protein